MLDHAITVRDILWTGGIGFVFCAVIIAALLYLRALNTDL